ncbi:MAG: hypothetical protein ACLR4Z_06550 [Butyricicoccaceae bacterium]
MIEDYIDTASADYAAYRLLDADAPEMYRRRPCARAGGACNARYARLPCRRLPRHARYAAYSAALHMAARPCAADCRKLEHLLGRSGMASSFIRPAEPLAADCANREHRPWQSTNGERIGIVRRSVRCRCSPCRFAPESGSRSIFPGQAA